MIEIRDLRKSYRREDSDCGIGYGESAVHRSGCGKFNNSCRRADSDYGIGYDKFAACRNGLGKFTNSYRGDCVRFRCICDGCNVASGHIPRCRRRPRRLSECPRGSRLGLSGGYEA